MQNKKLQNQTKEKPMKTVSTIEQITPQTQQARPISFAQIIAGVIALALAVGATATVYAGNSPANTTTYIPFGNALELQYAQPRTKVDSDTPAAQDKGLELLYAQPWMKVAFSTPAIQYNDLELFYAQAQSRVDSNTPAAQDKGLELLYALPWVNVDSN
jgi:hypothetical protein